MIILHVDTYVGVYKQVTHMGFVYLYEITLALVRKHSLPLAQLR